MPGSRPPGRGPEVDSAYSAYSAVEQYFLDIARSSKAYYLPKALRHGPWEGERLRAKGTCKFPVDQVAYQV